MTMHDLFPIKIYATMFSFPLKKFTRNILQRRKRLRKGGGYERGALILTIPSTYRYYFSIVSQGYMHRVIMVHGDSFCYISVFGKIITVFCLIPKEATDKLYRMKYKTSKHLTSFKRQKGRQARK